MLRNLMFYVEYSDNRASLGSALHVGSPSWEERKSSRRSLTPSKTPGEELVAGATSRMNRQCSRRRECIIRTRGGKKSSSEDLGKHCAEGGNALMGGCT